MRAERTLDNAKQALNSAQMKDVTDCPPEHRPQMGRWSRIVIFHCNVYLEHSTTRANQAWPRGILALLKVSELDGFSGSCLIGMNEIDCKIG